jgi:hypothetical protein
MYTGICTKIGFKRKFLGLFRDKVVQYLFCRNLQICDLRTGSPMTYADLRCGISLRICGFAICELYPKYILHEIKEKLRASKDDIPGCRFNSRKPGGGNKLNHRTKTQACRILYAFIPASFREKNKKGTVEDCI